MLLKKLLLITYHFPPSAASGAFRLLGFARHLPTFGWQPLVVAPPSLPWEPIDPALAEQIPSEAIVERVAYPARAPRLLRRFAQNAIWLPFAWRACKRMIAEHRPDAILTSGPPHWVHLLGQRLKRQTKLPWVADFRDPWISDGQTRSLGLLERWARHCERGVFANADLILANAPNATRLFREIYPTHAEKVMTLTNGFDPRPMPDLAAPGSCVRLLHAGEIYAGRDPMPLFDALALLNREDRTRVYHCDILGRSEAGLDNLSFVTALGQCAYEDTLDAMARADILVLFDSPGRTIGVPAKLYEYLGAGRPILALAEPDGDVAAVLRASGVVHRVASPKNCVAIVQALRELRGGGRETASAWGDAPPDRMNAVTANKAALMQFTRARLTQTLAERLDGLIGEVAR